MIELDNHHVEGAKIRVVGVGGGGGNAVNNMIRRGLKGVDFIAANTDKQALAHNLAPIKVQVGKEITRGLGAGANPEVGKKSVEETYDEIKEFLKGSDMIFVTSGMGGGTGTGGAPIVARIGQEINALVVGIVTKPFMMEGRKRIAVAENGIQELRQYVDALIVIPNQKLLDIIDKNTSVDDAFEKVDEVLFNATKGIADIISEHGRVNVDFADVRTIMKGMGDALMGIGTAKGDSRAAEATHNALNSPLLDGISIKGAQGVLVNITGGNDMSMHEIAEVVSIVEEATGSDVNLIHGVVCKEDMKEEIMVTVVATGFTQTTQSSIHHHEEKRPGQIKIPTATKEANGNVGKPSMLFGGMKTTYQNPEPVAETPVQMQQPRMINTPRGEKDLKSLDSPAFQRRQMSNMGGGFNPMSRFAETPEINDSEEILENSYESLEKPAFLRKIMD